MLWAPLQGKSAGCSKEKNRKEPLEPIMMFLVLEDDPGRWEIDLGGGGSRTLPASCPCGCQSHGGRG